MKMKHVLQAGLLVTGGVLLIQALRRRDRAKIPIKDKVVIITGAASGIGRSTAQAFTARQARVVLADCQADLLRDLADELGTQSAEVLAVPTDVTDDAQLEHLVAKTLRAFGRIDVLVNNAGVGRGGALWELAPEQLHQMLQVNLHGAFRLTQLVLPAMLQQQSGHIVNMSSASSDLAIQGMSIYTATKAAVYKFSECLRRELVGTGVYVSTIHPTTVRTAMTKTIRNTYIESPEVTPSSTAQMFVKSIYEPEDVAQLVVDAVRYRKRTLFMGGATTATMVAIERLAPSLMDRFLAMLDQGEILGVSDRFGA